ncbi:hypothetical protein MAR_001811 [Mya arenaria]|uniref:Uncharacterized protein n=1 Tax=Mya arenaria TaxID=6604 RepID=A0ABY7FGY2_MYAAR|nr:hypothetical protein MAR_001811 [Mya arenaria]
MIKNNRKLLTELPDWLVTRWARIAAKYKEQPKVYPPFSEFADFVSQKAKLACYPVMALQSLHVDGNHSQRKQNASKSFTYSDSRNCEILATYGTNCNCKQPYAYLGRSFLCNGAGPYSQKTDLGWGIVGAIDPSFLDNDSFGMSHRIVCQEIPHDSVSEQGTVATSVYFALRTPVKEVIISDVLKLMERDFCDSVSSEMSFTYFDRQFLKLLNEGIHFRDGHYEMFLHYPTRKRQGFLSALC